MTKTELAESMAEYIGWKWLLKGECKIHNRSIAGHWCFEKHIVAIIRKYPDYYFWTPEGFFAVRRQLVKSMETASKDAYKKFMRTLEYDCFWEESDAEFYIAFYSAVHEIRKK